MAVTPESAIATLEAALAGDTQEVRFADGRVVRYRTTAEIRDAIAYWRAQQDGAAGRAPVRVSVGSFSRGGR